jgi:hypothetical protein
MWDTWNVAVAILMVLGGVGQMISTIDRPVSASAGAVLVVGGFLVFGLDAVVAQLQKINSRLDNLRALPQSPQEGQEKPQSDDPAQTRPISRIFLGTAKTPPNQPR